MKLNKFTARFDHLVTDVSNACGVVEGSILSEMKQLMV